MAIFLVRHAESVANAGGVTMPHAAIPLSNVGKTQADELVDRLPAAPSGVLVSTMLRTRQTAEPYCARVNLAPRQCAMLDEFSLVDDTLIAGMDGAQRRIFVRDYWNAPDPHRRWGAGADTFAEFVERVRGFMIQLDELADSTVVFGHGIWLIMLHWLLQHNQANSAEDMLAFQRYRLAFDMPNCAIFKLEGAGPSVWTIERQPEAGRIRHRY